MHAFAGPRPKQSSGVRAGRARGRSRQRSAASRVARGDGAFEPGQTLQPKLKIGAANDPLEREADRVADVVISNAARGSAGSAQLASLRPVRSGAVIQRQPATPDDAPAACNATTPSAESFAEDPTLASVRAREKLLSSGSRSTGVRLLQEALQSFGCSNLSVDLLPEFGADGAFGNETEGAVRTFQQTEGLAPDGLVGPETLGMLDVFVGLAGGTATADTGAEVPDTVENSGIMENANVRPKLEPGGAVARPGPGTAAALAQAGRGRSLDSGMRGTMEAGFQRDFGEIRIHEGPTANRAASELNARAFTVGRNIWFGRNQFEPNTTGGQRLLAHELAHVVQQNAGGDRLIQRSLCPAHCGAAVEKGNLCTSTKVVRDACASRPAASAKNKITHIRIFSKKVELFFGGKPRTTEGRNETHPCTLNPTNTPTPFKGGKCLFVGQKCGENHTSWKKGDKGTIFNMGFFTEFSGTGMRFGFHDSQPVGPGIRSHGCVRVSCEVAQKINENTASGETTIEFVGVSKCGPKKKKSAGGGGSFGGSSPGPGGDAGVPQV